MSKYGKKYQQSRDLVEAQRKYALSDAIQKVKDTAYAGFDESISLDVNLGIDATKGEQAVKGSALLPAGTGKDRRVLVFATGDQAKQAEQAGADYVGSDDLIEKIQGGWYDFDYAVATPDLMGKIGKIAKILGPRGLLPNKKLGTVVFDVAPVVSELKKGLSFFKNDKYGLVHFYVGKCSFGSEALVENINAFMKALVSAKPAASKGRYIEKITLTSTMGPGVQVDVGDFVA